MLLNLKNLYISPEVSFLIVVKFYLSFSKYHKNYRDSNTNTRIRKPHLYSIKRLHFLWRIHSLRHWSTGAGDGCYAIDPRFKVKIFYGGFKLQGGTL